MEQHEGEGHQDKYLPTALRGVKHTNIDSQDVGLAIPVKINGFTSYLPRVPGIERQSVSILCL